MVDDTTPREPSDEPPAQGPGPEEPTGKESIHELHDPVMREHEMPRDGFEPISVWLIFLFFGLIGWGGWYLGVYSSSFRADVIDITPFDEQGPPVGVDEEVEPEDLDPMELGEDVFAQCAACHQGDGSGVEGVFPPLIGTERVLEEPEEFAALILHGIQGPITVDGVDYDDVMPDHQRLSDRDVAAVMTYVRNSWGNDADPIDEAFVAEIRSLSEERTEPWTDEELAEFSADLALDPASPEEED